MTAKKKPTPLNKAQFDQLFDMQYKINQMTCMNNFGHDDWVKQGWNWGLAIVDEVMEIHGHLGWKWWKGSDAYGVGITIDNKEQIKLEVIDLLHFMLSKDIQAECAEADVVTKLPPVGYGNKYKWSFTDALDEIIDSCNWDRAPWAAWYQLCCHLELGAAEIMEIYTGKYALNIFRQENGYGDGSYLKYWLIPEMSSIFLEDNWYLEQAIATLKMENKDITVASITEYLDTWYKMAIGAKS